MSHFDDDELAVYTKAFHDFDANHDGYMTLSEFSRACVALGFTYEEETIQVCMTQSRSCGEYVHLFKKINVHCFALKGKRSKLAIAAHRYYMPCIVGSAWIVEN